MTKIDMFLPDRRFQPALTISPDATMIAYSGNETGHYELWLQPVGGGEPCQLTSLGRTVRAVAWSPDGTELAFAADSDGDEQHQIYLISRAGGQPRQLTTAGDRQFLLPQTPFSADASLLCYGGNDRDEAVQDIILHSLADGVVRRIEGQSGLLLQPVAISPDGRRLLAVGERTNTSMGCYVADLTEPDPRPVAVTPDAPELINYPGPWAADSSGFFLLTNHDSEFLNLSFHDVTTARTEVVQSPGWDVEDVVQSTDGTTTAWTVNHGGRSELRVDRNGSPLRLPPVPDGHIGNLTVSADGRIVAFLLDTATRPIEIAAIELDRPVLRILTESRPATLRTASMVAPELIEYPSFDGRAVPAYLYRPAGATETSKCPMVLTIHGGPEAQERPTYSSLVQYWLSAGIGVLAPNIRGSTGYGKSYQRLIRHDWGGGDLMDLDHAAQYLTSLPWVDRNRIGLHGQSYGGFAVLSCLARLPFPWAAGVCVVGPANLVTLTRSVPATWLPIVAREIGDPETEPEFLLERSPIAYADNIKAPLFVIQGANDPRVTRMESDQIVNRLHARGVGVRYDVYEDEGHVFTKRANQEKVLTDIATFLRDHLRPTARTASPPWAAVPDGCRSVGGEAGVDWQRDAGDVPGLVGGQPQHGVADVDRIQVRHRQQVAGVGERGVAE